ncbi:MAG TPA: c-type cytochrome [Gammaproteobacteria bacterium]|nr:c-type cytochrome [Gammaproteobacteria bacterium]
MPAAVAAALAGASPLSRAQPQLARSALEEAESRVPAGTDVDLRHGLDLVMGRAGCTGAGQCAPCYQCHQIRGQGSVTAEFPRVAGQSFRYLYASLQDFASGRRNDPTMTPIARALTPQDMRDVAAFYSAQEPRTQATAGLAARKTSPTADVLAAGGALAAIGSAERGVQGCANCHGPQGAGLPPVYPYLAGQYPNYLEAQLDAWRSGRRSAGGEGFDVMADIAKRLTREDVHAVAEYYASIEPPRTLRDENYAGALDIGAPLSAARPEPRRNPTQQSGARAEPSEPGQRPPLQGEPPDEKLSVPPNRIP